MFGKLKKQTVVIDEKQIHETLKRGVDEVIDAGALEKDMRSGRRLRVKLGIDPTGPNIHIGHAVNLLKLRNFQSLGHLVVLIIGDATGVVGDTSDKDSERPMLSLDAVKENAKTYLTQAFRVLNEDQTEVRYNSEWLSKLTYSEIGEQADQFSVADFVARDNIKRRLDVGKRVSLREVLYPLMQGYDSVAVEADVEIGGTDQRFNLLAGRTLQAHYNQTPQHIVMTPLLEGVDGRKMSKSFGNTIDVLDEPNNMFGKIMRVHDDLLEKYFILATRVPTEEIHTILQQHPKEAKERLAYEVVSIYHGYDAANHAKKQFTQTFSEGAVPSDIPEVTVAQGQLLREALTNHNVVESNSDFRRLVKEGAIKKYPNGETIDDPNYQITEEITLRIGKHRFVKLNTD